MSTARPAAAQQGTGFREVFRFQEELGKGRVGLVGAAGVEGDLRVTRYLERSGPVPVVGDGEATHLRVHVRDDGDFAALYYYIPLDYHHVQISADYTFVAGNTRYGIYGNVPVTGQSGTGFGRFNPPYTMYGFINHKLNPKNEIWAKYAGLSIKDNGPAFGDWVFGFNTRF